jgi:peptidoglycan/xylan/chitin deacetylase (PgdA/CDA1 family)
MRTYRQTSLASKRGLASMMILTLILFYVLSLFIPSRSVYAVSPSISHEKEFESLLAGSKIQQEYDYTAPEQPTVYLTFDDGPSKLTDDVLDLLQAEGIQATFFVLGEAAENHPELLKRMLAEGHSIGNHTYDHVYKDLYKDFNSFWKQVEQAEQTIREATGVTTKLLRAPGGTATNFDAFYFYYLDQAGYKVHDWNVDSRDSVKRNVPAADILHAVKNTPLKSIMNVLLHDGSGHESTLQALPSIIQYYKDNGYTFAALSPEVEPIQFNVMKTKWNRGTSYAQFADMKGKVQQYALSHIDVLKKQLGDQQLQLVLQSEVAQEESAEALALLKSTPLQIKLGNESWKLDQDQYIWNKDRIQVPLRMLIERLGGKVSWDDESKTATAHYGIYDIEYDLPTYTMRVYRFGHKTAAYPMSDMKLNNGSIHVSLGGTMEQLGSRVSVLSRDDQHKEVAVDFHRGFYFRGKLPSVPSSLFALL